jgi:hypothetical protein
MRKLILMFAAAVPFAALAAQQGPTAGGSPRDDTARFERMEKRMRIARVLGLTEALDLNESQAVKVQETMAKFDNRRKPMLLAIHDSMQVLRRAANGDQAAQGQVDQAVARIFDTRAQIQQVDREMYQAITQGLSPEKRARAAVFLSHFQGRFGMGMGPGMMHGRGMMRGRGPGGGGMGGPGGPAMGPMGMGAMGDCPCADGEDCPEECQMMQ